MFAQQSWKTAATQQALALPALRRVPMRVSDRPKPVLSMAALRHGCGDLRAEQFSIALGATPRNERPSGIPTRSP
jgi:hypothetical protein